VSGDAFREFARATDAEVTQAAKLLDPGKLRKLLTDPKTPPERLSLIAYFLGSCGTAADGDLLGRLARQDNCGRAFGGLLAGYIQLRPEDGWQLLGKTLGNSKEAFDRRIAALSTLRFLYRTHPSARPRAVDTLAALVPQGDLSDLAVEDLRQWGEWSLTTNVLAQYGKKSHAAPMVRRAIVRYALCCPRPEAKQFVEQLRRTDRQLVQDVEESLEFEKVTPAPGR
jgi:hypothetical protein